MRCRVTYIVLAVHIAVLLLESEHDLSLDRGEDHARIRADEGHAFRAIRDNKRARTQPEVDAWRGVVRWTILHPDSGRGEWYRRWFGWPSRSPNTHGGDDRRQRGEQQETSLSDRSKNRDVGGRARRTIIPVSAEAHQERCKGRSTQHVKTIP